MDITAPKIPIGIDRQRDCSKTKSLCGQLLVPIDMHLMHGPNAVQGDSRNSCPVFTREPQIELIVEMIV